MALRLRWRELAAGCAAVAISFGLLPAPLSAFAAVLGILTVVIASIDLDRYVIPDLAALAVFLVGLVLVGHEGGAFALVDAAMRTAAAGGTLYLLRRFYRRRTGIEGLGLGDVKLAAAAGPWLMWQSLPFALAVAAVAALLTIGLRALLMQERLHWRQELPFGAFLAPAIWIAFLVERLWPPGT